MYCTYKRNVNQLGSLIMLFVYARKQNTCANCVQLSLCGMGRDLHTVYAIKNTYLNDSSLMPAFFAFARTLLSKILYL